MFVNDDAQAKLTSPKRSECRVSRPAIFVAAVVLLIATTAVTPTHADSTTSRLIVKFANSTLKSAPEPKSRVAKLAASLGVSLKHVRTTAIAADVVALDTPVGMREAERLAQIVARDPAVDYAEPDRFVKPSLVPNDPSAIYQTYLNGDPASINAYGAWDVTTGSPNTVVAVVDTGYTDHAGLAGRFLPGYDFVSDLFISGDGDTRDPDAHDPGDWVTAANVMAGPAGLDCSVRNSTWHGTAVAGVIAANSNDGAWTAGIDWAAKVLPVRVLGKCGGWDSDIIDGLAWAGGLTVPGVPPNPHPAQVINMSLGDYDKHACPSSYQTVIDAVFAHGVTRAIVASAGNQSDNVANYTPANCAGVISVGTIDPMGSKVQYSNYGAVSLSAPSGITVLLNSGTQGPVSDVIGTYDGTSFSAAIVSGVASLVLAVAPSVSANQLRSILTSSATPFPAGSNCASFGCGAGMVNAAAAVNAALASASPGAPLSGPPTVNVIEYYNATLDHYFITWVPSEQAALDAGNTPTRWTRTGLSFKAYANTQTNTSAVCRYYIPPAWGDSHFFGRNPTECTATAQHNPGFVLESAAFMQMYVPMGGICPANTVPVYRLFDNRPDANHRYVTDRTIRDQMVATGWVAEGDGPDTVAMCAPQ